MPSRSTLMRTHNRTPYTLVRTDANLDHGDWTDPNEAPAVIAPGATVFIESESNGLNTGTEGTVRYTSSAGGELYFHWDNPAEGRNSYLQSAPAGTGLCFSDGVGDNAELDLHLILPGRVAVPEFLPSTSGFRFPNHWPNEALIRVIKMPDPFGDITLGNASNGICGGMAYAIADYYNVGERPPLQTNNPGGIGDPLFDYLVDRLIDSLNLPDGVLTYYQYMDPAYPDTPRIDAIGRAWVMAHQGFPAVMNAVDAGRLCPLGLIMIKSLLPTDLGHNHQVLAYAYQLTGSQATIWVYDPNSPEADDVTLSFDLSNASEPIHVQHNVNSDGPVYAFFATNYSPAHPLEGDPSLRIYGASHQLNFAAGIRARAQGPGGTSVRNWFASG